MSGGPAVVDSDILSEIGRGHEATTRRARTYLEAHGRLTLSAVTVFERLRGYRDAIRRGRPLEQNMRSFEALISSSIVLPVDAEVADLAASLWSHVGPRARRATGDILIAATAAAHGLALVTRNRRDFEPMTRVPGITLELEDWSR